MSCTSAYTTFTSPTPTRTSLTQLRTTRNGVLLNHILTCKNLSLNGLSFRRISYSVKKDSRVSTIRRFVSPVMEWQDCTVKLDVDVPVSVAYDSYSDRESIPRWMPFISSVKVLEDKPDLSRWSLKYNVFGRDIEFSWLARNMQPTPNQKIHWRSLEGLPNRGAVRFYPKGPSACTLEGPENHNKTNLVHKLTVSYEVPQILIPVAAALQPFTQSVLLNGLERFAKFAKATQLRS